MRTKLFIMPMMLLTALLVMFSSCGGDEPSQGSSSKAVGVKSTTSVSNSLGIVIEAIMKDGTRQYYRAISPTEVEITNYYAYYMAKGFKDYEYKGSVVFPESISHDGNTYSVTQVKGKRSGTGVLAEYAPFYKCEQLNSVTLPSTIKIIQQIELYDGTNRKHYSEVKILAKTPPELGNGYPFEPVSEGVDTVYVSVYVPAESVESYKSAERWSPYADQIQAIK